MSWLKCPRCKRDSVFCIDSRPRIDGTRRRYKCSIKKCGYRFTTLEEIIAGQKGHPRGPGNGIGSIAKIEKDRLMKRIDKMLEKEVSGYSLAKRMAR